MSCPQDAPIVAVLSAVLIALNIVTFLAFYGWRRARAPWRTVLFTTFVICGSIVFDFFVLAIVPQQGPPKCP